MTQRYFSVNQLIVVFRVIQYLCNASYTYVIMYMLHNVINIHTENGFLLGKNIISEKGEI